MLGNITASLIDPVNEVVGLFAGNPARRYARRHAIELHSSPGTIYTADGGRGYGLNISCRF